MTQIPNAFLSPQLLQRSGRLNVGLLGRPQFKNCAGVRLGRFQLAQNPRQIDLTFAGRRSFHDETHTMPGAAHHKILYVKAHGVLCQGLHHLACAFEYRQGIRCIQGDAEPGAREGIERFREILRGDVAILQS